MPNYCARIGSDAAVQQAALQPDALAAQDGRAIRQRRHSHPRPRRQPGQMPGFADRPDLPVASRSSSSTTRRHRTATADLIAARYAGPRAVRYVRENIPGLGRAHNAGLANLSSEFALFTDDDVVVDPNWVAAMAANFDQAGRVGCVTGLILPAELDTRAQFWTERHGGFGKGFRPQGVRPRRQPADRNAVPLHRRPIRIGRQHGLQDRGAAPDRRLRFRLGCRHAGPRRRRPRLLLRGAAGRLPDRLRAARAGLAPPPARRGRHAPPGFRLRHGPWRLSHQGRGRGPFGRIAGSPAPCPQASSTWPVRRRPRTSVFQATIPAR